MMVVNNSLIRQLFLGFVHRKIMWFLSDMLTVVQHPFWVLFQTSWMCAFWGAEFLVVKDSGPTNISSWKSPFGQYVYFCRPRKVRFYSIPNNSKIM